MKKSIFLVIGFLVLLTPVLDAGSPVREIMVAGESVTILSASLNTKRVSLPSESLTIPLKRVGKLLLIEAEIDGMIGNFILDLGAPYLVLNTTYFRNYEVDTNYYAGTLLSGGDFIKRTEVGRLNIMGLEFTNLSADVTNLAMIENQRGVKLLGLLGVELFRNFVFDLDVLQQQLVLHNTFPSASLNTDLILTAPLNITNSVLSIDASSKDVKLKLSLDTGAERNILNNTLPDSFYEGMVVLRTSIIQDANGRKSEALVAVFDGIYVGETRLKKMATLILNLDLMSRAYGKAIDGMLGFPFFSTGRVLIDFKNKRLTIHQFDLQK